MVPKKVIIIGATSGIGRELALLYLADEWEVGVTGRRENNLIELKTRYAHKIHTASFDVMGTENTFQLQKLITEMRGIDLLIYNAGIGDPSPNLLWEIENKTTKTNVSGFVEIVSYAFNYFVEKGQGQIAVVSSMAALRGNSWAPAYSASKAYVSTYAEGLNIKAKKLKKDIVITDLKPGFIGTKEAKGNKRFWVASPHTAALQMKQAIDAKKRHAYIPKRWWPVAQLMKVLPYFIYRRLA